MEKALKILNEMKRKKIIGQYAIGGGVAAIRYMESILTYDVDIFFIPSTPDALLLDMTPMITFLKSKGGKAEKECVILEGTPIQLIAVYNDLVTEGVKKAVPVTYGSVKSRILRKEHVLALMLQTGRPKDFLRMGQMFQEAPPLKAVWMRLVEKYDLIKLWNRYMEKYGDPFKKGK
jgi:hypothetical protein